MKRNNIYFTLIAFFIAAVLFIFFQHNAKEKNKQMKVYYLLKRNGSGVESEEWKTVVSRANTLIRKLQDNPDDIASKIALARLYIQEGRISGNHMYYDRAAMKCVNDVLMNDENNFQALSLKAMILLSEHHFAEALVTSQKAVTINPYNAFLYGTLVDGYVEMGDYKAAVESLEKMMSIRPDMGSYARVSYLREIHGDYPGAIEAMKMAVDAGGPGDEATAWSRVQLGHLFEKTGDLRSAEMNYLIAVDERPGYAYALAGLARIAVSQKKYDDAIVLYKQADSTIHDYFLKEELSDVYVLKGQQGKADSIVRWIVQDIIQATKQQNEEDSVGHYSDRELAYAYLKLNENQKALQHALAEYNRRPENIDVNETLAWVYYKNDEYQKAVPYIETALRTNCKNPVLLSRAGIIYAKIKQEKKAKVLLEEALKNDPNVDPPLKAESFAMLQSL